MSVELRLPNGRRLRLVYERPLTSDGLDDYYADDYFHGYVARMPHPYQSSTGSEGRCDICGGFSDNRMHDRPWSRPQPPEFMLHGEPGRRSELAAEIRASRGQ